MKGFATRADVSEVLRFILSRARALPAEPVPVTSCAGRVLAEDVRAPVDVPGFARAAMDGYALRGEETFGASELTPQSFKLVGEALPGTPFEGRVTTGQAVRIMTGAPMPEGADAVAPAEVCSESGGRDVVTGGGGDGGGGNDTDGARENFTGVTGDNAADVTAASAHNNPTVTAGGARENFAAVTTDAAIGAQVFVRDAVPPWRNVGARGEDVRAGVRVLEKGRRLRAQDAGLLASLGITPRCHRRPRVRLVVSGDELLPAGSTPSGARIVDSNSVVLCALAARDGAFTVPFEILPDDPLRLRAALAQNDADALLVAGGSSVGREDFAPRLVAELGTLHFHGVAMRPSSPAGVGSIGERLVFLLPGNPVSCLCAYEFFAGPALRALGARSPRWPHRRRRLRLAQKISSAIGRVDYVRVALQDELVLPLATSGASILSSTVRAAGAVVVPRDSEGLAEGEEVEVLLYDDDNAELSSAPSPARATNQSTTPSSRK